jgi:hypothetical protein
MSTAEILQQIFLFDFCIVKMQGGVVVFCSAADATQGLHTLGKDSII